MVIDGTKEFRANGGEKCTLSKENIVTLNPGDVHEGLKQDGWRQIVLFFDKECSENFSIENEIGGSPITFNSSVKTSKELIHKAAKTSLMILESESELERQQLLQEIMGCLYSSEKVSKHLRTYKENRGIKQTIELMQDSPSEKHDLDSLAKLAGMSKYHYLRSFKSMKGITPHAYLNILRVEKAKKLLLTTDEHLTDIAFECGFADQAHFTRSFRKLYAVNPKGLRKNI
jgi:AraC-like DNA-binding protein